VIAQVQRCSICAIRLKFVKLLFNNNCRISFRRTLRVVQLGKYKASKSMTRAASALMALVLLSISVGGQENTANSWYEKGQTMQANGYYQDASNAYDQAILISPNNATFWASKALVLHEMGRQEDALQAYDTAIALYPDSAKSLIAEAWKGKGASLMALGRISEADAANAQARTLGYVGPNASDEEPGGNSAAAEPAGGISVTADSAETGAKADTSETENKNAAAPAESQADAYLRNSQMYSNQGLDPGMCL
jgi:tetratricopeptide (TPR) repeat protein